MSDDRTIFNRTVAEAVRQCRLLFALKAGNISTTGRPSGSQSGLVPPVPGDATQFLNGASPPAFAQVTGAELSMSDVTTNNVSTTKHGFAPKLPGSSTVFLDGTGAYSTPASSGGSSASPAALTDLTNLVAWFSADYVSNTVAANTGIITKFADKSGGGRDFTPGTGTIIKRYSALAGSPVADFVAGLSAVSSITLPLQGSMTFFGVFKVVSSTHYQNLFKPSGTPVQPSDMHLYWDQPSGKWQVDGALAGSSVAGTYHTVLIHFYNTGSVMHFKVRQDGAQILGDTASTNGSNPVPGSVGTPTNFGMNLMLDSVANNLPFISQIAEWGFYGVSKDGTEATLEQYLRAKYGTW